MRIDYQKPNCRRQDPRSSINRAAVAFRKDGRRSLVHVSEMSLGGLVIEGSSFDEGEEFWLVLPERGAAVARARWSKANRTGAMFEDGKPGQPDFTLEEKSVRRCLNASRSRAFGRRGEQSTL